MSKYMVSVMNIHSEPAFTVEGSTLIDAIMECASTQLPEGLRPGLMATVRLSVTDDNGKLCYAYLEVNREVRVKEINQVD